jgi:hypothetical protein
MTKNKECNIRHLNLHLCKPGCWAENELPRIEHNEVTPPPRLISFKECKKSKDYEAGVHFYIDDKEFEQVWTTPERYVELLSKFACVIMPDFSVYNDVALPVQHWNVYRSRVLGMYWQSQGIKVIPTIPFADYEFNCYATIGLPINSIVAVSTVGSIKNYNKRLSFQSGLDVVWHHLHPEIILVYGYTSNFSFHKMKVYSYEQFKISAKKRG